MNSACYIEGSLEAALKELLKQRQQIYYTIDIHDFETRKITNTFFNQVIDDLNEQISRATGINNYDRLFEIIIKQKLSGLKSVRPIWEGISILFNFRNVIAHGKEVQASLISSPFTKETWQEYFTGGYFKTEQYLLKKKIIRHKFSKGNTHYIYFNDAVADHFWALSNDFLKQISSSLDVNDKRIFDFAVYPS